MEALQLEESGFLTCTSRSLVVVSPNCEFTCSQGQARMLDYVVMDRRLVATAGQPQQAHDTPWRPHVGLDCELLRSPRQHSVRSLIVPKRFEKEP
eukprot:9073584-Heterocapsa_arctica.AAC.1